MRAPGASSVDDGKPISRTQNAGRRRPALHVSQEDPAAYIAEPEPEPAPPYAAPPVASVFFSTALGVVGSFLEPHAVSAADASRATANIFFISYSGLVSAWLISESAVSSSPRACASPLRAATSMPR